MSDEPAKSAPAIYNPDTSDSITPTDYFAGLAMQALLTGVMNKRHAMGTGPAIAKTAYEMAEHMMAARDGKWRSNSMGSIL